MATMQFVPAYEELPFWANATRSANVIAQDDDEIEDILGLAMACAHDTRVAFRQPRVGAGGYVTVFFEDPARFSEFYKAIYG